MSVIEFHFKDIKPVPLNNLYATSKSGRRFKSKKAGVLKRDMDTIILSKKHEIFDFEAEYSIYEHFLCSQLTFFMPRDKLFTKKGYIGMNSGDVDNFCKPVIDNVFSHFDKIDDSAICQINAIKAPSPDDTYSIYMSLVRQDLDILMEFYQKI